MRVVVGGSRGAVDQEQRIARYCSPLNPIAKGVLETSFRAYCMRLFLGFEVVPEEGFEPPTKGL